MMGLAIRAFLFDLTFHVEQSFMNNTRHFRTLTDTPDPNKARQSAEVADHIAAFLANGGKINPVGIKPAEPEVPRFNGKNHEDIGKTYQQ